jgi:hypothetical protein
MNTFTGNGKATVSGCAITFLQLSGVIVFSAPEQEIDINMAELLQRKILPGDYATYKLLRGKNSGRAQSGTNYPDLLMGKQTLTTEKMKGKNTGRKKSAFNYSDDFFNNVGGNI